MKAIKYLMMGAVIAGATIITHAQTENGGTVLMVKDTITQSEPPKHVEEKNKVFYFVEQMPSFPGGTVQLMKWLAEHLQYPAGALKTGVQGRVIIRFIVERDGSITDANVVRSVDSLLDKEAVRVVSNMPKWIPGKQHGVPVRVEYHVPVTFRFKTH